MSYKYFYMNVRSSFICNSAKPEITQIVINRLMEKYTMVYPHSAILLNVLIIEICYSMDES